MKDILLVSFGALLGANFRFIIYQKLEDKHLINDYRILIINTFASFFLGLFIAILPQISYYDYSSQLALFFLIGLLGSLSTFSTFIYDLVTILIKFEFFSALKLFFISMLLGIVALAVGYFLGNQ